MTPADVFNLLNETTQLGDADGLKQGQAPNKIVYPIRLLEVGSLGPKRNPIHFFKNVGQNGFLIRFDYEPEIPANWNWRSITARVAPNFYEIDGKIGSYKGAVYEFDSALVGAVIEKYELLRTVDILTGTDDHTRTGRYTLPHWNPCPHRNTCPYLAALIVRFHEQNPAYWVGPAGPAPAPWSSKNDALA
jgi:hypothetical protein